MVEPPPPPLPLPPNNITAASCTIWFTFCCCIETWWTFLYSLPSRGLWFRKTVPKQVKHMFCGCWWMMKTRAVLQGCRPPGSWHWWLFHHSKKSSSGNTPSAFTMYWKSLPFNSSRLSSDLRNGNTLRWSMLLEDGFNSPILIFPWYQCTRWLPPSSN